MVRLRGLIISRFANLCNEKTDKRGRSGRPGFFVPARVLSRVFRGKYLARLRQAFDQGQLVFPGKRAALSDAAAFARWMTQLCHQDWVVYAKASLWRPEQVLKYLAHYTHHVAIGNQRLADESERGQRRRTLTPVVTTFLFLKQILHGNTACSHLRHLAGLAFSDAAYCRARGRLPFGFWHRLQNAVTQQCFDADPL